MRPSRLLRFIVPIALGIAALAWTVHDGRGTFFTHDSEAELLAVRSIVDSGFTRISIPWTEAYPSFREELLPFEPNFLTVHEHRLYASRPLLFVLLSAVMFRLLGIAGLYVIPVAAGIATIVLTHRLARSIAGDDACIPFLPPAAFVAVATPLVFYGLVYWNMILGALTLVAAVLLLVRSGRRRAATGAGVVLGLGVGIRPDLLVPAALLVPWIIRRRGLAATLQFLSGLLGAGAVLAIVNLSVFGNVAGPHLTGNRVPLLEWLLDRPRVLHELFLVSLAGRVVEGVAVAAFALAIVPTVADRFGLRGRAALLTVFAAASAWIAAATIRAGDPFAASLENHSLLACAPVLFLAFALPAGEKGELRSVRVLALGLLVAIALLCPSQAAFAAHWGPRMFLPALPLVALAAYVTIARLLSGRSGSGPVGTWMRAVVGVLLVTSAVNQVSGLRLLHAKRRDSAEFQTEMARDDLPILTDQWVLPVDLASWYPHRALWFPDGPQDLEGVFRNLSETGRRDVKVVAREDSPLRQTLDDLVRQGRLRREREDAVRSGPFPYRAVRASIYALPD